jgi:hypothetical protein
MGDRVPLREVVRGEPCRCALCDPPGVVVRVEVRITVDAPEPPGNGANGTSEAGGNRTYH